MSEHAIDQLTRRLSRWACIVGPQAAGKSTYVQYLQQFESLKGNSKAGWHLHPDIESALGGLHIDSIRQAESIPLLRDKPQPIGSAPKGFSRIDPTKDILHFEAVGGRGAGVAGRLGVDFFDVPGEWARLSVLDEKQRAPLERLLARTSLVVLLVPFWSLLPAQWLIENVEQVAGDTIWATSMAMSASRSDSSDRSIDRAALAVSVESAHRDVTSWVDTILTVPRQPVDVLIVLSQFQENALKAILDGYSPQPERAAPLGTAVWNKYEALLGSCDLAGHPLAVLSTRLADLLEIGRNLLWLLQKEGSGGGIRYAPSPALEALHRLYCFDKRPEAPAVASQRKKIRSVSIFPQNTVRMTPANLDRIDLGDFVSAQTDGDLRMCEDIVWWIVLQLMAGRLWTP